jgi:hypothetical protein
MKQMPYTQIDREALPPRLSVLGYVKVGGKSEIRYSREGKPYALPERYVEPARFEVVSREKKLQRVEGKGKNRGKTFTVDLGFKRDEDIHRALDQDPLTEIPVRLMFPTAAENFQCHFGCHDGTRWVCQGNGREAQDQVRGEVPCPCPRLGTAFEGEYDGPAPPERRLLPCKPRGVLSVVLEHATTFGGFHVYKTTSWESIANIRTQLEMFERLYAPLRGKTGIADLPLLMKVYPATKGYGSGDEGGLTTQPIVTLVLAGTYDTARQLAAEGAEESRKFLLAAGGDPDPEQHQELLFEEMRREAESEGAEFFPEARRVQEEDQPEVVDSLEARMRAAAGQVVEAEVEEAPAEDGDPDHEIVEEGDLEEPEQDSPTPDNEPAPEGGVELPDWDRDPTLSANPDEEEPGEAGDGQTSIPV